MSDKHKAFMNHSDAKMPKGGKDAFADMEPAERDAHMKSNPLDDGDADDDVQKAVKAGSAFLTPEGVVLRKSAVGAEVFGVMKAQQIRLDAPGRRDQEVTRRGRHGAPSPSAPKSISRTLPAPRKSAPIC